MRIRVNLLGDGSRDNPYRADLPTYTVIGDPDPVNGRLVVDIRDEDAPEVPDGITPRAELADADLDNDSRIPAREVSLWHKNLDERYSTSGQQFRPQQR